VKPATASAEAYLASRTRFGVKFGLDTIRVLVAALGHPERVYPTLLVAGTNGKGSVVAYADAALRAAGLRVGRYTSPHLVSLRERIAVGGRPLSAAALARAVDEVRTAADGLVSAGRLAAHPTYFEAVTAAAFVHFRRARVDVAVLEVGMGGRLDATNVSEPLASAIVTVALDHEAYLGHGLPAIAREKAGVLRRGRTAVLGRLAPSARRVVARRATLEGARLVDALGDVTLTDAGRGQIDVATPARRYRGVRPLLGAHQRDNVVVAIRLLEAARAAGLRFDLGRAAAGLSRVRWPGRLQWIPGRPRILVDGAHNPAGARALAAYLKGLGPFVLVFGAMADKSVDVMARTLFPLARHVVLTKPRMKRAAAPAEIARRAGAVAKRAHRAPTLEIALARARSLSEGGPIVVAGSLFLAGEVLALARRRSPKPPAWSPARSLRGDPKHRSWPAPGR
jgi:dihydrofolate synthase / folylpolyglutamate synthase